MKLILTRIDNRLIHGQVLTEWCEYVQADVVVVANDAVAKDHLRKSLMKLSEPKTVTTYEYTLEQTIQVFKAWTASQNVVLLCETPQDVLQLVQGGIPIHQVNVGNMQMAPGKQRIATSVAIDENDREVFQKLKAWGIECEIRPMPQSTIEKNDALY